MRVLLLTSLLLACAAPAALAQGQVDTHRWSGRTCKVYVPRAPAPARSSRPLLVMLHGCTQDPDQFAQATAINRLAERRGWLVLYPQQPRSANFNACWNWYQAKNQVRGRGEPALLAGIVARARQTYPVDPDRIYVAGLSAGAGMSVIMGATYPDVFAAIGVAAGLEYGAARNMWGILNAMQRGGPSPTAQGLAAYRAMGTRARPVPVIVFHGDADKTVAVRNGDQVVKQWIRTNDLALNGKADGDLPTRPSSQRQLVSPGGRRYTVSDHRTRAGRVLVRNVRVAAMGHAWSGGAQGGTYVDPAGPNASAMLMEFLAEHRLSRRARPTPTAPTTPSTTRTLSLRSEGSRDGWVARYAAWGLSSGRPRVGDFGIYRNDDVRAVLSFDTSQIPAGARIQRALLRVRRVSLQGAVQSLRVSLQDGALGRLASLGWDDFGASLAQTNLARLDVPAADGGSSEVQLPASALSLIRPGGRVQIRLSAVSTSRLQRNRLVLFGGEDGG